MLQIVIVFGLVAAQGFAQEQDKPTKQSINDLIAKLESRDFRVRQRATRDLLKIGVPAIEPLHKRVYSGRLELAVRAMSIFESAYVGKNPAAADAADLILEEIALSKRQELAEQAIAVLQRNQATRTRRAIVELVKLGGEVTKDTDADQNSRFAGDDRSYLVIDKQWTGGVDGLKYVRRLMGGDFQIYIIDGVPIPEKDLLELEASFELPIVARRGPAMLGISGSAARVGCMVSSVTAGKAARRAGIREGDVILEMDGESIEDFAELVEMLRPMQPDQEIRLKVMRDIGREPKEIVVKLDRWKAPGKRVVGGTKPMPIPRPMPPGPEPERR